MQGWELGEARRAKGPGLFFSEIMSKVHWGILQLPGGSAEPLFLPVRQGSEGVQ